MSEIVCKMVRASLEDLDEIHALTRLAADRSKVTAWDEGYPNRAILTDDLKAGVLYKSVHEGKIISIMLIRPWGEYLAYEGDQDIETWDPAIENPCGMARFCVDPRLQGRGLGRRMMQASIDKARELGFDGIHFQAAKNNPLITLKTTLFFSNENSSRRTSFLPNTTGDIKSTVHSNRNAAVTADGAVEYLTKIADMEIPKIPTTIIIIGCFSMYFMICSLR